MRLSVKKTLKTKPIKKIKETEAIFEHVHEANAASDQDPQSLRLSIDCKAKVKIGNLSRGGKDRPQEGRKADDHDTEVEATLVPFGILDVLEAVLKLLNQSFQQHTNGADLNHGLAVASQSFVIPTVATVIRNPRKRAFHLPAVRFNLEPLTLALNDLDVNFVRLFQAGGLVLEPLGFITLIHPYLAQPSPAPG